MKLRLVQAMAEKEFGPTAKVNRVHGVYGFGYSYQVTLDGQIIGTDKYAYAAFQDAKDTMSNPELVATIFPDMGSKIAESANNYLVNTRSTDPAVIAYSGTQARENLVDACDILRDAMVRFAQKGRS